VNGGDEVAIAAAVAVEQVGAATVGWVEPKAKPIIVERG
jgi:hypothetical protein